MDVVGLFSGSNPSLDCGRTMSQGDASADGWGLGHRH